MFACWFVLSFDNNEAAEAGNFTLGGLTCDSPFTRQVKPIWLLPDNYIDWFRKCLIPALRVFSSGWKSLTTSQSDDQVSDGSLGKKNSVFRKRSPEITFRTVWMVIKKRFEVERKKGPGLTWYYASQLLHCQADRCDQLADNEGILPKIQTAVFFSLSPYDALFPMKYADTHGHLTIRSPLFDHQAIQGIILVTGAFLKKVDMTKIIRPRERLRPGSYPKSYQALPDVLGWKKSVLFYA